MRSAAAIFTLAIVFAAAALVSITIAAGDRSTTTARVNPDANSEAVRSGGGTVAAEEANRVKITAGGFEPDTTEVSGGGRLIWVNQTAAPTGIRFTTRFAPKPFAPLTKGKTGQVSFQEPGTYQYVSTRDPSAKGTVIVR
jgi:plastocyanin